MNDSIWQSIAATSWWMYAFILYLVYYAYYRSKPQLISVPVMIFTNSLLILCSALGIYLLVRINITNIILWIAVYFISLGTSWLHLRMIKASVVKNRNLLLIPGSFFTAAVIFASLAAGFFIPYQANFDLNLLKAGYYSRPLVVMYALAMGLAVSRILYTMRTVKYGPYITADALPAH